MSGTMTPQLWECWVMTSSGMRRSSTDSRVGLAPEIYTVSLPYPRTFRVARFTSGFIRSHTRRTRGICSNLLTLVNALDTPLTLPTCQFTSSTAFHASDCHPFEIFILLYSRYELSSERYLTAGHGLIDHLRRIMLRSPFSLVVVREF